MATKFVYSAAAGLNDGSSWTNAWTSLASSSGVAAGDIVKVHKTHSQTGLAANINWSNGTTTSPVLIVCVDKDVSDALATGANVAWGTTGVGPQGNIFAYGITWAQSAAQLLFSAGTDGLQKLESCTISCTGSTGPALGGTRAAHVWRNTNIDLSGASGSGCGFNLNSMSKFEWWGGTYTCRGTQTSLFLGASPTGATPAIINGVTFSGTVTNLFVGSSAFTGTVKFAGCIAPTYTAVIGTPGNGDGWQIDLEGLVASGTITAAILQPSQIVRREGTITAMTSRYRTGGADDGSQANAYSWELATNANAGALTTPLSTPSSITRWVAAGASQTITVYVASGGSLNNDEFWIEVLSPSEAVSPTGLANFQSTRLAPLGTPSALTTDGTSTWNGTGVGTKQKVSVTINPTVAGRVIVRPYLAKASTTVYVDPVLDLTGDVNGKSRFVEGVQTFSPTSGGTAGMLYRTGGG